MRYVVITPAKNEARTLGQTIQSVAGQTVQPAQWIIVSDGSTDGTDEIVRQAEIKHPWIRLVRVPETQQRTFSGKVNAFNAGYQQLGNLEYDAIASLDADITFEADYFEFLLNKLAADPTLGLVGTPFRDKDMYDYRFVNIEHVSGACQVFRRECFERIGGYTPLKGGGIDLLAVLKCRMAGWKTRTFTEHISEHHRVMGTAQESVLRARYKYGVKDYSFGNHPVWELSRGMYQMTRKPYVVGAIALLSGYFWSLATRRPRPVPSEVIEFQRQEQMQRLRRFLHV